VSSHRANSRGVHRLLPANVATGGRRSPVRRTMLDGLTGPPKKGAPMVVQCGTAISMRTHAWRYGEYESSKINGCSERLSGGSVRGAAHKPLAGWPAEPPSLAACSNISSQKKARQNAQRARATPNSDTTTDPCDDSLAVQTRQYFFTHSTGNWANPEAQAQAELVSAPPKRSRPAAFDAGPVTSDAGALPLGATDRAGCSGWP